LNFWNKKKIQIKKPKGDLFRPFVGSLEGHQDGILKVNTHPFRTPLVFTGASDGEIKFWLINERKCLKTIKAHAKFIRGLEIDYQGRSIISCSDDYSLKMWEITEIQDKPKVTFKGEKIISSLASHQKNFIFATGGEEILIWDQINFKPIQQLFWGISSISSMKFNPIEHNILISSGSDRSIVLYDLRLHLPVKKFQMEMRSNAICWNHVNSSEFTLASEDSNLYSFDLRNLSQVKKVYKGHVLPVLSLAQDKKNQDLLSGSLDSTIRIFPKSFIQISEIFFNQRMNRVLDVCFSADQKFILSGSEDGNLRIWKRFYQIEKGLDFKKNKKKPKSTTTETTGSSFFTAKNINTHLPQNVKSILKIKEIIYQKKKKKIKLT